MAAGATSSLSDILQRASKRSGGAPTVTVRVDSADTARALALAARKGVPCETYLKTLLHEALDRDEVSH